MEKFKMYFLSFSFLCFIFFPILNDWFGLITDIAGTENRKLAPKPEFNIKRLDYFPRKYENYYNDTFCLRNRILFAYDVFSCLCLKKSPHKTVAIGKEGWLFVDDDEMDVYTGDIKFATEELKAWKKELEYREDYLKKTGSKFYFMIVPAKQCIYPEYLPAETIRQTDLSMGEKLENFLSKNSRIQTISLYETLRSNKGRSQIYYKLDNHWNSVGAFYGANKVLDKMRQDFPGLGLLSIDSFKISAKTVTTGNITKMIGDLNIFSDTDYLMDFKSKVQAKGGTKKGYSQNEFPYPWKYEEVKEIKGSEMPKLLLICDSFGDYIFPFLSEEFGKTVKIWDSWEYKLNEKIVEQERPDAVLLMISEKNLTHFLKHQSRPQ